MTEHDRELTSTLADKLDADIKAMRDITTERPSVSGSVADQMVGVAQTIKGIHRDIDALQAELANTMAKQFDAIRKRLGGRG